eukprot:TRINITY_DN27701_c0_g1_i1.p1 TRINITY_DN27701_c0_g1~~TRINITY_DN27701_c0_g1_i1.p1  ORF type:complete len:168 (-),score=42.07 TRINITY_DN27701_c0_g1_i1:144-647(-)
MIRRHLRSTLSSSSAASDVYKRQVESDKIGIGCFYWSFPSKLLNELQCKQARVDDELAAARVNEQQLILDLQQAQVGKEESDERACKMRRLQVLEKQSAELDAELGQYEGNSAEFMKTLQEGIKVSKVAVNRWTDNLDAGRKYLRKKFQSEKQVLDNLFPEMDPLPT